MIDEILAKYNLKYEDLNSMEKETFHSMLDTLNKVKLSPERLKDYIASMKFSVETELANEPEYKQVFIFKFRNDKNIYLKARLRNYMLLDAFLMSPEKAQEALDKALSGLVPKKVV